MNTLTRNLWFNNLSCSENTHRFTDQGSFGNLQKCNRAGQDQGGPRWDTLTKKSKSTKLLHIMLCYTQGVVAYDPVLFGSCIPLTLTSVKVKLEALILISFGGRTLQCGVMYIFNVSVLLKLTFITNCGIGKSKGLYNNSKKIRIVSFLYFKISLNMWQAIHSLGWPRSGWPHASTLCYKFVTGVNHHTYVLLVSEMMASNMKK